MAFVHFMEIDWPDHATELLRVSVLSLARPSATTCKQRNPAVGGLTQTCYRRILSPNSLFWL